MQPLCCGRRAASCPSGLIPPRLADAQSTADRVLLYRECKARMSGTREDTRGSDIKQKLFWLRQLVSCTNSVLLFPLLCTRARVNKSVYVCAFTGQVNNRHAVYGCQVTYFGCTNCKAWLDLTCDILLADPKFQLRHVHYAYSLYLHLLQQLVLLRCCIQQLLYHLYWHLYHMGATINLYDRAKASSDCQA